MARSSEEKRDALVHEGARRLLSHGVEALMSEVKPYKLARQSGVSKDTAYRVFEGPEKVLEAVAGLAADQDWGGYAESHKAMVDSVVSSLSDPEVSSRSKLTSALEANIRTQFRSRSQPLGWMLQAASLTGSRKWERDDVQSSRADLAEKLLELRRSFYRRMTDDMVAFFRVAMSELQMRPREGWDAETIVVLIHCLVDGAVLRMFLDPESITPKQVAEAAYELGIGLGERGTYVDPRRREDEGVSRVFEQLVTRASRLWKERKPVGLESLSRTCKIRLELVKTIFPTEEDLADSVVRSHVASGGFAEIFNSIGPLTHDEVRVQLGYLRDTLGRLADCSEQMPDALKLAKAYHERRHGTDVKYELPPSFFETMSMVYGDVLRALSSEPDTQLNELVQLACQGSRGQPAVKSVIDALERTTGFGDGTDGASGGV